MNWSLTLEAMIGMIGLVVGLLSMILAKVWQAATRAASIDVTTKSLDRRIVEVERNTHKKLDQIHNVLDEHGNRLTKIETKLEDTQRVRT